VSDGSESFEEEFSDDFTVVFALLLFISINNDAATSAQISNAFI
jgi:hypothetical protein